MGREHFVIYRAWWKLHEFAMSLFPRVLLFGDSLTQKSFSEGGWGAAIANHLQRKCDVLNRGFNGYTSAFNKLILPRVLQSDNSPQGSIAAAVVLLGSNDSVLEGLDNRSLTLQQYTENMCDILKQLLGSGLRPTRIVLVSPPAVCEDKWRKHVEKMGRGEVNLSHTRTKEFSAACVELGEKHGVRVLDLCSLMLVHKDWQDMLEDGLHFSVKGNQFLATHLIPILESELGSLPMVLPDWKDIDAKCPDKDLMC